MTHKNSHYVTRLDIAIFIIVVVIASILIASFLMKANPVSLLIQFYEMIKDGTVEGKIAHDYENVVKYVPEGLRGKMGIILGLVGISTTSTLLSKNSN